MSDFKLIVPNEKYGTSESWIEKVIFDKNLLTLKCNFNINRSKDDISVVMMRWLLSYSTQQELGIGEPRKRTLLLVEYNDFGEILYGYMLYNTLMANCVLDTKLFSDSVFLFKFDYFTCNDIDKDE